MKATVFLDIDIRPAFNEVYAECVDEPYPDRNAAGVDPAVDADVEVVAALE